MTGVGPQGVCRWPSSDCDWRRREGLCGWVQPLDPPKKKAPRLRLVVSLIALFFICKPRMGRGVDRSSCVGPAAGAVGGMHESGGTRVCAGVEGSTIGRSVDTENEWMVGTNPNRQNGRSNPDQAAVWAARLPSSISFFFVCVD